MLLEHGADPNITDKYGQTPLMYAVGTEWIKMIPLLVKHGADVNSANMTVRGIGDDLSSSAGAWITKKNPCSYPCWLTRIF